MNQRNAIALALGAVVLLGGLFGLRGLLEGGGPGGGPAGPGGERREGAEGVEGVSGAGSDGIEEPGTQRESAGGGADPVTDDVTGGRTTDSLGSPWVAADRELDAPADRLEQGDSELILRIVDRATRRSAPGFVHVWRRNAPANDAYGAGDQLQAEVWIGEGRDGESIQGLPPGEYQILALAQRFGALDLEPIRLGPGKTVRYDLPIDLPMERRVRAEVFDEDGQRLGQVLEIVGRPVETERGILPQRLEPRVWTEAGKPLRPYPEQGPPVLEWPRRRGGTPLQSDGYGFDLGTYREDSKERNVLQPILLNPAEGCAVEVVVDGEHLGPATYVGVSVDPEPFEARVLLPDNRPAGSAGATIRVTSRAQRLTGRSGNEFWKRIPIKIEAQLEGYRDLEVIFTLADGPPAYIKMERE